MYVRKPSKTVIFASEVRFIFILLIVDNLCRLPICCGMSEFHGISLSMLPLVRRDRSS